MSAITDIQHKGWTQVDFALPIEKRAHFAKLGNQLMDLIVNDDNLRKAFTVKLAEDNDDRAQQAHMFMVSPALHSADDKLWFHSGYQTRAHVNSVIPEAEQPPVVKEFLDTLDEMLEAIEQAFEIALTDLEADAIKSAVFDSDRLRRVIHIRTVRYNGARRASAPTEPVAGHADLGLCTLHLFETHGHWFQAAPYDQSIINDDQTPERQAAVQAMRQKLNVITEADDKAIFFLGASWKNLPKDEPPKEYQLLPACYHAGIRPSAEEEFISPFARDVVGDSYDRVSLVVFTTPNLDYCEAHPEFRFASVSQCRPDTAVK